MRHLLFDIDGTLILTGRAGSRGMLAAISELTGVENPVTTEFQGRTDSHLLPELLRINGADPSDELVEQARRCYYRHLQSALEDCQGRLLPGVSDVLGRLNDHPQTQVGLLTGNLPKSAQMKLSYYGIWDQFGFGFYGDISPNRDELAHAAWRELSANHAGIQATDIVIIGDTPMDVQCAKAIGAKCLACATGGCTQQQLAHCGADWTMEDFSDVQRTLQILVGG